MDPWPFTQTGALLMAVSESGYKKAFKELRLLRTVSARNDTRKKAPHREPLVFFVGFQV
jgi:hypothetical protein